MIEYILNILGGEWIIIIFVGLLLILGTNQLPGAARKLGKTVAEFNRAREEVQSQMRATPKQNLDVSQPVESERQKLEMIAKSLGIEIGEKSDDEVKKLIAEKMEVKEPEQNENK